MIESPRYILKFLDSENYYEKELQEAVEHYWNWIFPDYRLIYDRTRFMPQNWMPDLFAINKVNEHSVLLGELKVDGTKITPFRQVAGYAQRLLDTYNDIDVRLFVMGPWNIKNNSKSYVKIVTWDSETDDKEENRRYTVKYIPFKYIGLTLIDYAEKYLENLVDRWNDPDLMRLVGIRDLYPSGLEEKIKSNDPDEATTST